MDFLIEPEEVYMVKSQRLYRKLPVYCITCGTIVGHSFGGGLVTRCPHCNVPETIEASTFTLGNLFYRYSHLHENLIVDYLPKWKLANLVQIGSKFRRMKVDDPLFGESLESLQAGINRVYEHYEEEGFDLKSEMTKLKTAIRNNADICNQLEDEDIGKMVSCIYKLHYNGRKLSELVGKGKKKTASRPKSASQAAEKRVKAMTQSEIEAALDDL